MSDEVTTPPNPDLEKIRQAVADRQQEEAEHIPLSNKSETISGKPDDPRFVLRCLEHNERGDGILFAAINKNNHIFNKTTAQWLTFAGHHWEADINDSAANSVEAVALCYKQRADNIFAELQEAREKLKKAKFLGKQPAENASGEVVGHGGDNETEKETEITEQTVKKLAAQHKKLISRIDRLRSKAGIEKTLWHSHIIDGGLRLRSEDLDQHPLLLPCPNGVLDLETGLLLHGRPDQYLMRAITTEYHGIDKVNQDFHKFVLDIYQEDEELVAFIQRLLGYCLTGLKVEHFIACFCGVGRNGKGTLFEIIHEILGELCWAINPEMLLEQKTPRNSASHSADLISLRGRRLVIGAEADPNRRISPAAVKRLTGGDIITARAPNDRDETNFEPTHKTIIHVNDLPAGLAKDFALFERLLYIEHPLRYVDDPKERGEVDPHNAHLYRLKDRELGGRLRKNPSGILAWLVVGCLQWQKNGLKPPDSVRAAVENIRDNEDHLGRFLDEVVEKCPGDRVSFKDLYSRFKGWFEENVDEKCKYIPTKLTVSKKMRERGFNIPSAKTTSGNTMVLDIALSTKLMC